MRLILCLALLLSAATVRAQSGYVRAERIPLPPPMQFIDRILRPCPPGGTPYVSAIAAADGDFDITTCTGRSVTVNGTPLVITPGGGLGDPGSNGYVVRTALNSTVARMFSVSLPLTITNGDGVLGNTTFACPTCVTSAASLTSTALMTGAGLQAAQTPAATATLAANGNISTPGTLTTGNAGGANGALDLFGLTSGTFTQTVNNAAGTWTLTWPDNDGTPGQFLQTDGAGVASWQTVSAGTTINATDNVLPKRQNATTFVDSRITDDGTDLLLNSGAGFFRAGDYLGSVNGSQITIDDAGKEISLVADDVGSNTLLRLIGGATPSAQITTPVSSLNFASTSDITFVSTTKVIVSGAELQVPNTIRTGNAANTDLAGLLTVGAGGTITYTFTQTHASAPVCVSSDTNAAPNITGASATTTTLTVTGTVGHVVSYICIGRN